jgi:hypothetical protein
MSGEQKHSGTLKINVNISRENCCAERKSGMAEKASNIHGGASEATAAGGTAR